ncbi:MAG: SNF2-related protein [Propylenella sp.]
MGTLKVLYDVEQRVAILECRDDASAWISISRVCNEFSDQIRVLGPSSLSMPWWQFLAGREAVGYHVHSHGLDVEFDSSARVLLERAQRNTSLYANSTAIAAIPPDDVAEELMERGFSRELTPEQKRNVSSLSGMPSGATFSVPGAGKTTEALALFFLRAQANTRLLVIAPKNAFAAWERELKLCVPLLEAEFVRLVGGRAAIRQRIADERPPRCMLVTYHQLQFARDEVAHHILADTWIFLDESHRIKRGLEGKIGSTILSLSYIPERKLILSGTPMPNSVADLVPQFRFLFPEVPATAVTVTKAIQPFYVRTTKKELGLRPPDRLLIPVPMSEGQSRLYRLAKSETARQAELALRDRGKLRAVGRSVVRLLQIVSNPMLVAQRTDLPQDLLLDVLREEDSPKIQYACDRARELANEGKKVVIWTGFVANIELLSRRLADLSAQFIHGGVDAGSEEEEDTREWKIKQFHIPSKNWVLVANPAACGEGISLHEVCHNAIYVDRNYNAAQYLQSEDRIHRLGLARDQRTFVEILFSPGSVDESVDRRLRAKVQRMAEVLNDHSLHIDPVSFDPAEIEDDEVLDSEDAADLLRELRNEEAEPEMGSV